MRATLATAAAIVAFPAVPAAAEPVDDLFAALRLPDLIDVMREEGLAHGRTLAEDMLEGGATPDWQRTVSRIYDTGKMEAAVRAEFEPTLADADLGPLIDFFAEGPGERITDLEIAARSAMVDQDIEAAAREEWRELAGTGDSRLARIEHFTEVNDLVESNVAGALNASFMFYRGLAEGGSFEMSEQDMLADVWAQEPETRAETEEWVKGFLLMAYEPLADDALDAYIALSATEAGQALNRALFEGFNAMYADLSYATGLAVSQRMRGTEL